jgi:hypothetical protein
MGWLKKDRSKMTTRFKFDTLLLILAASFILPACAGRKAAPAPYPSVASSDSERLQESLFKGDQADGARYVCRRYKKSAARIVLPLLSAPTGSTLTDFARRFHHGDTERG